MMALKFEKVDAKKIESSSHCYLEILSSGVARCAGYKTRMDSDENAIRWKIPCLLAGAAQDLLDAMAGDLQTVYDGGMRSSPDPESIAASRRIQEYIKQPWEAVDIRHGTN